MTKTTCDICGNEINITVIRVRLLDGEHPHNRSTMYRTIDACVQCASKIPDLRADVEFDEMVVKIHKG